MTTLHTFGCSITQGFALPDVVRSLTPTELQALGRPFYWTDAHVYQPSDYAWPQLLADKLGMPVQNHARRGACMQQIARQCAVAVKDIKPQDTVIVMWTYLSRLSLQWPARTTVPLCNVVDPNGFTWRTVIKGFNRFFGLDPSEHSNNDEESLIQEYIHNSTRYTYLNPMGMYDRYYNQMLLMCMTDGFLRATGARVIHLSVEPEPYPQQLESVRQELVASLRAPHNIPHPDLWYRLTVDHLSCRVIHDPSIPPAENDMHPSVQHHANFAAAIHQQYFVTAPHMENPR